MKALLFVLAACAGPVHDVSPRAVTAEQTQCELEGVTVKDYEDTAVGARWNATCYGRVFACAVAEKTASCVVDEQRSKQGDVSTDVLLRRFNSCHAGQKVACHSLAEDYELGRNGIPPNRFTAIELYGEACKLGVQRDCVRSKMLEKASQKR